MKLFSCTTGDLCDEHLVEMPGFSHRSQPFKVRVSWYPFEDYKVRVWFYARNRSHAVKQLVNIAGRKDVRDLDSGSKCAVPDCMKTLIK